MSRYHLISITLRRSPGDRAYHIRESFDAGSLSEACQRHVAFMRGKGAPRCSVLRDGSSGERYSLEASQHVVNAEGAAA
jgi:hypothetical protein